MMTMVIITIDTVKDYDNAVQMINFLSDTVPKDKFLERIAYDISSKFHSTDWEHHNGKYYGLMKIIKKT